METKKQNKAGHDPEFLISFIKEDREEIRLIKNRIYTYMQILIAASLAITAFFIKGCIVDGVITLKPDIRNAAIIINSAFLLISFVFSYFQYQDLKFVRRCLKKREKYFNAATGADYFDSTKKMKKTKSEEEEEFLNDKLLSVPMIILGLIYVVVIVGLIVLP